MNRDDLRVGDFVLIHPACSCWMQGVTSGTITIVGRKWIHVRWLLNPRIVVQVSPVNILSKGLSK